MWLLEKLSRCIENFGGMSHYRNYSTFAIPETDLPNVGSKCSQSVRIDHGHD